MHAKICEYNEVYKSKMKLSKGVSLVTLGVGVWIPIYQGRVRSSYLSGLKKAVLVNLVSKAFYLTWGRGEALGTR